jgi:3-phenylpropionate/trans-cinnamate dioxygenase ferredoxin reductase subunit
VDRKAQRVEIGDEALPYDRLLIATGSMPRRLDVEGASLEGVAVLRDVDDAVWLSRRLETVQTVAVVGAGAIGLELASAARTAGKTVTVVDVARRPLSRILRDHPLADRIAELHAARGVDLRLGLGVRRLLGDRRVEAVELTDGGRVEAELVLASIGVRPNVELAGEAGLVLDDGIVVDGSLRTSDPSIFAAGDVARTWIPRYRRLLRFEQYGVAQQQGRHAARAMLGDEKPFAALPGFGTSAYGVRIQFAGLLQGDEDVRVSEANAGFMAYFLKQRRLQGLLAVNQPKAMLAARPLLESNEVGALERLGV